MDGIIHGVTTVAGAIYVLFAPGFALSFLFFTRGDESVDIIERITLSFALSIASVPLLAFYLNLAGVKINRSNILLEVLGIIVLSLIGIWLRGRHKPKGKKRYETDPHR